MALLVSIQIDQKIEDMFASRKHVTDVAKPSINQMPIVVPPAANVQSNQLKLKLARQMADRINYQKHLGPDAQDISQQAAIAIMKGESVVVPQVAVSIYFVCWC